MTAWLSLLCLVLVDLPPVDVETLRGETHRGRVTQISPQSLTVQAAEKELVIPVEELLEVRWQVVPSTSTLPPMVVTLTDGSRLSCSAYSMSRAQAALEGPYGALSVPAGQVAHVRFTSGTDAQTESWNKFLEKRDKDDSLITLAKDGSLDRLTGVIGDVGAEVHFLIDGDEIKVKREKLYGLVYRKREALRKTPAISVRLLGGDFLAASAATWSGEQFQVTLLGGSTVTIPPDRLRSLDYSGGKVRYLSDEDPREITVAYAYYASTGGAPPKPAIEDRFQRNRALCGGGGLLLNRKLYPRGLGFFPDATVRYRIGGEFSRFKAIAGIDDRGSEDYGDARVSVSGDGKTLFETQIKRGLDPVTIDVNVVGVRDLVISVTHAGEKPFEYDTGDFVDLVEARVVK